MLISLYLRNSEFGEMQDLADAGLLDYPLAVAILEGRECQELLRLCRNPWNCILAAAPTLDLPVLSTLYLRVRSLTATNSSGGPVRRMSDSEDGMFRVMAWYAARNDRADLLDWVKERSGDTPL